MDFPGAQITPLHISPFNMTAWGTNATTAALYPTNATWPSANYALFTPVTITAPYPVNRVFMMSGSGGTTSIHHDFGIYTPQGARIWSVGAGAQGGASTWQYTTPSPTFILDAGRYFFAYSCDSTTSSAIFGAAISVPAARLSGMQQMASAYPLPSSATFAALAQTPVVAFAGVTRTASGY